jgi:hypothetical protein
VPERHHAAVAEDEIEARRGDRQDDDLAGGAEVVGRAEGVQGRRQEERQEESARVAPTGEMLRSLSMTTAGSSS